MITNYQKKTDIVYEPADKRRFYRLSIPIKIRLMGNEYKTVDWSVNAFKITGYTFYLEPKEELNAEFELNFQGFALKFSQKVKVLRIEEENNAIIAEYADLTLRNREILGYFSRGILSGEFQPFNEVIKHVDIPISEDYLNKTFIENPEEKKSLTSRKLVMLLYIIVGIVALLYFLNLYYTSICLLQIDSAIISGKTEVVASPLKGIVSEIYARENSYVEEGQPLFKISDLEIEREIADKENEILKNEAFLKEKQKQLQSLQARLENYKNNFYLQSNVQEKIISSTSEEIDLLKDELARKNTLYSRQLVSKPEIDKLKGEILQQEQKLAFAKYEYSTNNENLKNPENAINSAISKKEDSESLKAEIEKIEEIIKIEQKELSFIRSIKEKNTIKAPFKAILLEITAFKGKYSDEKTPIIVLKDISGEKFVEAYLTESEALKLKLGLKTRIHIPSQDLKLTGRLVKLEKRNEFLGRDVIIGLIKPDNPDLIKIVNDATPVKVTFIRKNHF
ncbi:MAG TPA: hypothetical protein P5556_07565 [Candidatus Gastranaerophilales bacterium]|nr:hypothetical protein [Candidatus Gastranaerophilales bacterium]